jgi:hypothetical protein
MGRGGNLAGFLPRADRGRAERIPYDPSLGHADEHVALTMRAMFIGGCTDEPFTSVLGLLSDCASQDHGRPALRQSRGATYKQLACVAHLFGMSRTQRRAWYALARAVPLSEQHAHHLITRLKRKEAA